jgi:hypothetical protein
MSLNAGFAALLVVVALTTVIHLSLAAAVVILFAGLGFLVMGVLFFRLPREGNLRGPAAMPDPVPARAESPGRELRIVEIVTPAVHPSAAVPAQDPSDREFS